MSLSPGNPRLVDSHCHLDRLDLAPYAGNWQRFLSETRQTGVDHLLCVSISLEAFPAMQAQVAGEPGISLTVGVHPNETNVREPTPEDLVTLAQATPGVVAMGETGLDYFHGAEEARPRQAERFRRHIAAARHAKLPLVVHSRAAPGDTLQILREAGAREVGGVLHCFTEDWPMARAALDLGFYISFSGILTFRNAETLRDVARRVPMDRLLVETDAPYLAPVPYRGQSNRPTWVVEVAKCLADLRGLSLEEIAAGTTDNFYRLFPAGAG
ncbi:MAG: TatD family hydrolase [Pseudomonadota bacterium]